MGSGSAISGKAEYRSLLLCAFAKETLNFKEPTNLFCPGQSLESLQIRLGFKTKERIKGLWALWRSPVESHRLNDRRTKKLFEMGPSLRIVHMGWLGLEGS